MSSSLNPSPSNLSSHSHTLSSRIRGSLFGLTTCDALGAPLEFSPRSSYSAKHDGHPLREVIPNPNFGLPAGHWTDDTSMTLCLAQSLVASTSDKRKSGGEGAGEEVMVDVLDAVKRWGRWWRHGEMSSPREKGCFDIGNATRVALSIWGRVLGKPGFSSLPSPMQTNDNPKDDGEEILRKAQKEIDRSLKHKAQCGNGALMRCSPLALIFHDCEAEKLKDAVYKVAELTHPYPTNGEACTVYCELIRGALHVESKEALAGRFAKWDFHDESLRSRFARYKTPSSFRPTPNAQTPDQETTLREARPSFLQTWHSIPAHQISSSGYVVHTLEASLWSFFTTDTFEEGAVKAVNLGDDADTVGAVYGALAGAYYGLEEVPERWVRVLARREVVEEVVEGVVGVVMEREEVEKGGVGR